MSVDNSDSGTALVERFRIDPVGLTVQIEDGTEGEVVDVLEGEYGPYLKLHRSRRWVHVSQVVALIEWGLQFNPAAPFGRPRALS